MSKYSSSTSFIDLLFNLLLAFVCLFILSFLLINPQKDAGKIDPNAEFMIMISWDDESRNDIDLWVEDFEGNIVYFSRREAGLMHLDRDARGSTQRTVRSQGADAVSDTNQEIVTIRGFSAGEYIVNIHGYSVFDSPEVVKAQVIKLNPYGLVCEKDLEITRNGEELTLCRFTLNSQGRVIDKSDLPKSLFGG